MTGRFKLLLACVGVTETTPRVTTFANDFVQVMDTTRYLCWVSASPGDVVNLKVSYTTTDARRMLGRGTVLDRLKTLKKGLSRPSPIRSLVWDDWFRQFGLAPINYEFSIPSHRHAGSYYFTLEPPPGTDVTYLDWESGNSLATDEVDCSVRSAHIHNDDQGSGRKANRGGAIRAYIRCQPTDHKLIVGTALLNAAFVILISLGRVPGKPGSSAQTVLLAAPSIYIAYLARQQHHYYADAMRRQRGIIWSYLAISVIFLVTITFSHHEGALGSRGLGFFAMIVTWAWGATSIGIAVWFAPLGGSYERVTESHARRALRKIQRTRSPTVPWESYANTVSAYARGMLSVAVLSAVAMVVVTHAIWHYPPRSPPKPKAENVVLEAPSDSLCKGCTLNLRLPLAHAHK